jgi:hypothetical protein
MRFCLTVFPLAALLAASLPSQSEAPRAEERIVQDGDTAMRKQAEATLMQKSAPRTYLPIEGLAAYDKAVQELDEEGHIVQV